MISLCTLFNSNYLDKGLVLIDSLSEVCDDFILYVLSMDEKTEEVLGTLNDKHVKIIPIKSILEFEPRLIELKNHRGLAEFCWTCTSVLCEFILTCEKEKQVTYIDADMYFYNSPQILLDELFQQYPQAKVGIMEHRFPRNYYYRDLKKNSGKYCIEFNTFTNDETAIEVCRNWKEQCLKSCNAISSEEVFGDQKYVEKWPTKYGKTIGINKSANGGIAPWNIKDYYISDGILLYRKRVLVKRVFYHFAGMEYMDEKTVNVHAGDFNKEVLDYFYKPYICKLEAKRDYLNREFQIDLRKVSSKAGKTSENEFRNAFADEIKQLLKMCRIITAIKKIVNRFLISRYARKHFGTAMEIYHI